MLTTNRKLQLLVPELHPINWWLFWALSFVVRVRARVINVACSGWPHGRIQVIDPSAYLTADTATRFKADVLVRWQTCVDRAGAWTWAAALGETTVDFAPRAKQELSRQFERMQFLNLVHQAESLHGRVVVVDSALWDLLRRWVGNKAAGSLSINGSLSLMNRLCDRIWLRVAAIAYGVRSLMRFLRAAVVRPANGAPPLSRSSLPIVFDCDNPNEYYLARDRRTFTWVVDDSTVHKQDVLFVFIGAASESLITDSEQAGYAAGTLATLYRHAGSQVLTRAARETLAIIGRLVLPWTEVEAVLINGYLARAAEWMPIYERWRPRVYVESVSSHGVETPAIAYLKAKGVRCVLYQMAGSYVFSEDASIADDFRSIFYAHVLASEMAAWHSDQANFYLSHPQDGLHVSVLGPLMAGDERVMQAPQYLVRRQSGLKWQDDGRDHLYVVAFDVGAASKQHRIGESFKEFFTYPDCYTATYNEAFLADVWALLEREERIRLIYKPKRNPSAARFAYSAEDQSILRQLAAHPRGAVLSDNINPWMPLAIADLCLVLPLTSPGLAALHYGVPVVYHDPLDIVRVHRQPFIASLMTHSLAELVEGVAAVSAGRIPTSGPGAAECLGRYPGTNSSDHFRRYLMGVREVSVPAATGERPSATGLKVTPAAAGSGLALSTTSPGANEALATA